MEWIIGLLALTAVIGGGLAFYEWRSKRTLLAHDFNQDRPESSHAAQEAIRAEEHARNLAAGFHERP